MAISTDLTNYGFLGPIVGISGMLVAAGAAISFSWGRALHEWKPPPDVLPVALSRTISLLCALSVFLIWFFAEPALQRAYVILLAMLGLLTIVALLSFIGVKAYCGRFSYLVPTSPITEPPPPTVPKQKRGGKRAHPESLEIVIWGGFRLTERAKKSVAEGTLVEDFLKGNLYKKDAVWTPGSQAASAVVTAALLLTLLVAGTSALTCAAASAQVALTGKAARATFSSGEVPGISTNSVNQH
jgi:hypothetical protein